MVALWSRYDVHLLFSYTNAASTLFCTSTGNLHTKHDNHKRELRALGTAATSATKRDRDLL